MKVIVLNKEQAEALKTVPSDNFKLEPLVFDDLCYIPARVKDNENYVIYFDLLNSLPEVEIDEQQLIVEENE